MYSSVNSIKTYAPVIQSPTIVRYRACSSSQKVLFPSQSLKHLPQETIVLILLKYLILFIGYFYINGITLQAFLCLPFFIQYSIFQVHSCSCLYKQFILYYSLFFIHVFCLIHIFFLSPSPLTPVSPLCWLSYFVHQITHMSEVIWYLSFSDWALCLFHLA